MLRHNVLILSIVSIFKIEYGKWTKEYFKPINISLYIGNKEILCLTNINL